MQAITTKYLAPTNTLGSRIKVKSWLGSKIYSYDYASNEPHHTAFSTYLQELNLSTGVEFKQVAVGSNPEGTGYVFIVE